MVWKGFVMKIVWRNPESMTPKRISIINTGRVEAEELVQLSYRASSGVGILGTDFELLLNCSRPRHVA
jgi:hypothetical protein